VDGEVAEGVADRLATRPVAGFELELGDVGTFGRGRAVRVVWLGLRAGAEGAIAMAATVEEECLRAGLSPEARAFQPHLTLARARARGGAALPALAVAPRLSPWRADRLVLYSSRVTRAGATYEVIRTLRLA
jgi:2'-5' RNA ligase